MASFVGRTALAGVVLALAALGASAGDELKGLRAPDAASRLAALRAIAARPRDELRPEASALRPVLRRLLLAGPEAEVRGLAARALLHLDGDAAVPHVLDAMRSERDPAAERLLAEAWAGVATAAARDALAGAAVDGGDRRLAALAAEALGHLGDRSGAATLLALTARALPWSTAAGACLGLRGVRDVQAVERLVAKTSHPDPAVRAAAREALVFLTHTDRGPNPREWEAWWDEARATFRLPDGPPPERRPDDPAAGRTSDSPAAGGAPTWAEFFGLPIRGARVAFVIDYSQSMWGERRARAEGELLDAVKSLPSTSHATVVFFNERVWRFRPAPIPGRPQEKLDLAAQLPELETKSYTNLFDAIEDALALLPSPGVDDVIVLSDGVPNRGRLRDPDRICAEVRSKNAGRARISCVALSDEGAPLLRRIAAENGGAFASAPVAK